MTDISSEQIKALLSKPETLERIASMVESFGRGGLSQVLAGNAPESRKPENDVQPQNEAKNTVLPASAGTQSEKTALPEETAGTPAASGILPSAPLGTLGAFPEKGTPDRRITLLKAIRPYVNDAKKERVDGLVRALSVAGLLNNYKNTLLG